MADDECGQGLEASEVGLDNIGALLFVRGAGEKCIHVPRVSAGPSN